MHFEVEIVLLRTFGSKEMWEGAHPPKCDSTNRSEMGGFAISVMQMHFFGGAFFMHKTTKPQGGKEKCRGNF